VPPSPWFLEKCTTNFTIIFERLGEIYLWR
jgi:hypothetical protein